MKYSCDKQQWYLYSFLLGVKLWEELHKKSIFWKFSFIFFKQPVKGRDDIRTEHVRLYMWLCKSCHVPISFQNWWESRRKSAVDKSFYNLLLDPSQVYQEKLNFLVMNINPRES